MRPRGSNPVHFLSWLRRPCRVSVHADLSTQLSTGIVDKVMAMSQSDAKVPLLSVCCACAICDPPLWRVFFRGVGSCRPSRNGHPHVMLAR